MNQIMLGFLAIFFACAAAVFVFSSKTSSKASAEPATTTPARSERSIRLGETFSLREGWYCVPTEEGFDEVTKWFARQDLQEASVQLLRHGGVMAAVGENAKLLDRGWIGKVKVRLLKSEIECWMPSEAAK